jgi:hypothetical protein
VKARKLPWHLTDAAGPAYRIAREKAQALANETGFDYGIEANDLFREFRVFMLPMRANRSGHELRCEVVHCTNLATVQIGHGP